MSTRSRTPQEIRASIEQNRTELGQSLERLRGEVVRLTDWRGQLRLHQQQAMVAAGVTGFVLGGGLAAIGGIAFGRRRRKPPPPRSLKELVRAQVDEFVGALRS
ncbi:MAG TPA: DUF3618 domain-containing protein [Solirubrobacteraceae bacterium]|jgi:hypothetical protein